MNQISSFTRTSACLLNTKNQLRDCMKKRPPGPGGAYQSAKNCENFANKNGPENFPEIPF